MGRGEVFDAASDEVFGVCFWQHHEFCFRCAVADDVAHDGEGGFVGDHEDGDAECCQGGGDIGDAGKPVRRITRRAVESVSSVSRIGLSGSAFKSPRFPKSCFIMVSRSLKNVMFISSN